MGLHAPGARLVSRHAQENRVVDSAGLRRPDRRAQDVSRTSGRAGWPTRSPTPRFARSTSSGRTCSRGARRMACSSPGGRQRPMEPAERRARPGRGRTERAQGGGQARRSRLRVTSAGLFKAARAATWEPVGQGTGERKLNMGGVQSIVFDTPEGSDMTVAIAGAGRTACTTRRTAARHWDRASGMPRVEGVYYLTTGSGGNPIYAGADDGVFACARLRALVGADLRRASAGRARAARRRCRRRIRVAPVRLDVERGVQVRGRRGDVGGGEGGPRGRRCRPPAASARSSSRPPSNGQFGDKHALVGTEKGVYATIDDGEHWGQMSPDANPESEPGPAAGRPGTRTWATAPSGRSGWASSPPSLMAGTPGLRNLSLPLQPIQAGNVTLAPSTGPPSRARRSCPRSRGTGRGPSRSSSRTSGSAARAWAAPRPPTSTARPARRSRCRTATRPCTPATP